MLGSSSTNPCEHRTPPTISIPLITKLAYNDLCVIVPQTRGGTKENTHFFPPQHQQVQLTDSIRERARDLQPGEAESSSIFSQEFEKGRPQSSKNRTSPPNLLYKTRSVDMKDSYYGMYSYLVHFLYVPINESR